MICDYPECNEAAECNVAWGANEHQRGNFCQTHIREIWDRTHNQIKAGVGFWMQTPCQQEEIK